MKRQKRGGVGTHFRNEPDNHRVLVNMILACFRICFFLGVKIGSGSRCQFRFAPPLSKLNQEEVTAWAYHRPQVCAVDEQLPTMSRRLVQPTQQDLVVKASQETVFLKKIRCWSINSSERDQCAMLMEKSLHRIANNFPNQDPSNVRNIPGRTRSVRFRLRGSRSHVH